MDSKSLSRSKRHKKRKSASKGNGNPEVFVLPPDLLQKLGINLGNVGSAQAPDGNDGGKAAASVGKCISVSEMRNSLGEESIMTTASLMKKSVSLMLSPTFVPTTNVIPGEMEIACMATNPNLPISNVIAEEAMSKLLNPESEDNEPLQPATIVTDSNHNNEIKEYDSTHVNETKNLCNHNFAGRGEENETGILGECSKQSQVIDSNSMNTIDIPAIDRNAHIDSQKKSSKVNILSEERIGPSKLKRIKTLCVPQMSVLTPVTKDTIISTRKNNHINHLDIIDTDEPTINLSRNIQEQNIVDNDSYINGNFYTEALIVMNDNSKHSNKKMPLPDCLVHNDDETMKNLQIEFECPISHYMNDAKNDSGNNLGTSNFINSTSRLIQENSNCQEEPFETTEHHSGIQSNNNGVNDNNLDGHIPVIIDCNISNNETSDVTVDVFNMSLDDSICSADECITYESECSNVNLLKEVNANINCIEDFKLIKHLIQEEDQIQVHNTIYDKINGVIPVTSTDTCKENFKENNSTNIKINNNDVTEYYKATNKILSNNIIHVHEDIPNSNLNGKTRDITLGLKTIPDISCIKNNQEIKLISFTSETIDKEPIDGNYDTVQSKLCIQGVEKPGGMDEIQCTTNKYKVLKTYKKINSNIKSRLPIQTNEIYKICNEPEEGINISTVSTNTKVKEFCICDDFGRLNFYDKDDVYEHLHFWQHRNTSSDLDLIFSIYHEDGNINKTEICNAYVSTEEEIEESVYNICWNDFQYADKSSDISGQSLLGLTSYKDSKEVSESSAIAVNDEPSSNKTKITGELCEQEGFVLSDDQEVLPKTKKSHRLFVSETRGDDLSRKEGSSNQNQSKDSDKDPASEDETLKLCETTVMVHNESGYNQQEILRDARTRDSGEMPEFDLRKLSQSIINSRRKETPTKMHNNYDKDVSTTSYGRKKETFLDKNQKKTELIQQELTQPLKTSELRASTSSGRKRNRRVDDVEEGSLLDTKQNKTLNQDEFLQPFKTTLGEKTYSAYGKMKSHRRSKSTFEEVPRKDYNPDSNINPGVEVESQSHTTITLQSPDAPNTVNITPKEEIITEKNQKKVISTQPELSSKVMKASTSNIKKSSGQVNTEPCIAEEGNVLETKQKKDPNQGQDSQLLTTPIENKPSPSHAKMKSNRRVNNEPCIDEEGNVLETKEKKYLNQGQDSQLLTTPIENKASPSHAKKKSNRRSKSKATIDKVSKEEDNSVTDPNIKIEVQSQASQSPDASRTVNDDGGEGKICVRNNENEQENAQQGPSQPIKLDKRDEPSKVKKKRGRPCKRRISALDTSNTSRPSMDDEPDSKKQTKCGVCNMLVSEARWEDHIITQHQFIAWRAGDTLDLDNADLRNKLYQSLKMTGYLKCTFCSKEITCLRKFMTHVKSCMNLAVSEVTNIKCGVCKNDVLVSGWHGHIGKEHNYLAWIEGENPLDSQDNNAVRQHLLQVAKQYGDLICFKCGAARKRAASYLTHVETCSGNEDWLNDTSFVIDLARPVKSEEPDGTESQENSVTCAVCLQTLLASQWMDHISKEHNYLAWPVGTKPLNLQDDDVVKNHLQEIIRWHGGLTCAKCGLLRKRALMYLTHVKNCVGPEIKLEDSNLSLDNIKSSNEPAKSSKETIVTCAVCNQSMSSVEWVTHISTEHNYLAWQEGSPPLDMNNEIGVRIFLTSIGKENGGLVCHKCGSTFKFAISYLDHVKEPCGVSLNESNLNTTNEFNLSQITADTVKCGVCAKEVQKGDWFNHIQVEHAYRAWLDGQEAPDFDDHDVLHKFLTNVAKAADGLKCSKCGLVRKYAKSYLQHVDICQIIPVHQMNPVPKNIDLEDDSISDTDKVECGMCHKKMKYAQWKSHAMQEHYNIAWIVGDTPIDLNSPYLVETYLKQYQVRHKNMTCKVCGISRISRIGFYAHILICGKSDEEKAMFQRDCDICNKKYLIIYQNQHMTAHRESELARERKLIAAEEKEKKRQAQEEEQARQPIGRRKAAENAKKVIKKYETDMQEGKYKCNKCGLSTDIETVLAEHECKEKGFQEDGSDSDASVKLEHLSEDESVDTDTDSNVSYEETSPTTKRSSDSSPANKIQRFPYTIKTPRAYLRECGKEFIAMHLSAEDLFMQWRTCEYEPVVEDLLKYLPTLEESCQLKYSGQTGVDFHTFKRFEASKHGFRLMKSIILFAGDSIQCVSWVPARSEYDSTENNYLAVVTHRGPDMPRYQWEQKVVGPGLIQLWNCADLKSRPEFVLGIAHDYGTVWSISWCPSGVRDAYVKDVDKTARLGLVAAACSNGSVYIFSVPYPSTIIESDKHFYKLKPVAELKMAMGTDRKTYQATAAKWSPQKGHSHVIVGYSDGSVAYYDLNTDSPLLRSTENNMNIFYPYYDEKYLKNCIEDLDIFPTMADSAGAVSGSGLTGSLVSRGAGLGGSMSSQLAVSRGMFQPHWPSVMLSGDEAMSGSTAVNELEWWGGGRRFGGARGTCACARCGRVVAAALPLLRTLRAPPHHPDTHKQIVGVIEITPLSNKITKKQNDDISMVVEPTTYEDAVKKYGIRFEPITDNGKTVQRKISARPRPPYPERFPLADITSMAFCPTLTNHDRLAVAVHAGFVFIMSV